MNKSHNEALIRTNREMLRKSVDADISFIPDETDVHDFPVKYGMPDNSVNSDNVYIGYKVTDVRFVVNDGGVCYFAGKDGFVWFAPESGIYAPWNEIIMSMSLPVYLFDSNFFGDVPDESKEYGWYVARLLSDMVWTSELGEMFWSSELSPYRPGNTGNTDIENIPFQMDKVDITDKSAKPCISVEVYKCDVLHNQDYSDQSDKNND